ncbi:MAG: hypothetical protein ACXVHT_12750 [Methanobacterium sp.]
MEWHNLTVDLIECSKDSESLLMDLQRKLLFKSIELGLHYKKIKDELIEI